MPWRLLILLTLVLASGVFVGTCCSDTVAHERKLWQVERDFGTITHPAGARPVAREAQVGLLSGNGNHCDYFVGELRRTVLPRQTIVDAYRKQPAVEVAFFEAGKTDAILPWGLETPAGWGAHDQPAPGEQLYAAYLFLGGEDSAGDDWRCH